MNIFDNPLPGLEIAGKLRLRNSREIAASRFSVGFECLDRKLFNPAPCYDRAAQLGVKWARCQTGWGRCETVPGVYDFSWLDKTVEELLSRGIQPWFNVGYGNPLYMKKIPHPSAVGCVPINYGTECLAAWQRYVEALSRHFRGRVRHFEIWNEPDLLLFWQPDEPDGAGYARLLAETVPAVRRGNPDAVTIGTVSNLQGGFTRAAIAAGAAQWVSRWSFHAYGILPEFQYENRIRYLERLFSGPPRVRLWQGETGYPHQPFGHKDIGSLPFYRVDETMQAKLILRRMILDTSLDLELTSYFHISDLLEKPYVAGDGVTMPPTLLGLLKTLEYIPKEGFYSFQNAANCFDAETTVVSLFMDFIRKNTSLRNEGGLPSLAMRFHTFERHDYGMYVWYMAEDVQKNWFGENSCILHIIDDSPAPIENPVLVDLLSGRVWRCLNWTRKKNEVEIRELPLTDWPLLLTDYNALEVNCGQ